MPLRVTDTGFSIIFTDFQQVGAYDYTKRKMLWRHFGDGEPLCDPVFDKAGDSVYILDEDSKADDKGKITKNAEYLRLYKFHATTGKQLWKAVLFKIPKDCTSYSNYCEINLKDGKVVVLYTVRCQDYKDKSYTFTVRASDGKPWK
jgi:outer membrane protein assembly factor BamB